MTYKFNKPIKTLLSNFENKKSGKVMESRREIRRRFDYLDRSQQVRFLKACFNSCNSDREWACEELTLHWDPQFTRTIELMWENLNDEGAMRCIVKNFPLEYIVENMNKLSGQKTYYDLCLRLCPYFKIKFDKEKLTPLQRLSLYSKGVNEVSEEEITGLVHEILINIATDEYLLFEVADRNSVPSCRDFAPCRKAFYFLMEMDQYAAMGEIMDLDERILDKLGNSSDFHAIRTSPFSDSEYREMMSSLVKKVMHECLKSKGLLKK